MNREFLYALYAFCYHYYQGQNSRLHRILTRLREQYNINLKGLAVSHIACGTSCEWVEAHYFYKELKEKYANDTK